jgi:hypothetical protein
MTDYSITPGSGSLELKGSPATLIVTRVAETWQFFAFVFAALATFALTLLDEIPDRLWPWRIAAKLVAFLSLAYLVLINGRVRGWLSTPLVRFKQERR